MALLRQVRFPLKLKLLSLMIILIAGSLIVFVGIALQIFKEDKGAYIFESLLNKASSEQIILSQKLGAGFFEVVDGKLLFAGADVSALLDKELGSESVYGLKLIIPKQTELILYQDKKLYSYHFNPTVIIKQLNLKSKPQKLKCENCIQLS